MSNKNDNDYNGWKNYETWNLNLWIQNDEGIYLAVVEEMAALVRQYGEAHLIYPGAIREMLTEIIGERTPDGVSLTDPRICWPEIIGALEELHEETAG